MSHNLYNLLIRPHLGAFAQDQPSLLHDAFVGNGLIVDLFVPAAHLLVSILAVMVDFGRIVVDLFVVIQPEFDKVLHG